MTNHLVAYFLSDFSDLEAYLGTLGTGGFGLPGLKVFKSVGTLGGSGGGGGEGWIFSVLNNFSFLVMLFSFSLFFCIFFLPSLTSLKMSDNLKIYYISFIN